MENFIVSARKYRPDNFRSVVGQEAITSTLKNAIKSRHLAHAYLFCGPRGVGKTTCARILAKTINCLNLTDELEACNECESCQSFNQSKSFNIHELDAASNNSVEDIRNLIEQVRIPPQVGKYSIYIIDEVHMLSQAAFNAFLKTLEEPPAHAIFILATTEKHKILPTILSRCQVFDFNRIQVNDTVEYLEYIAGKESIKADKDALNIIAQKSDGGMRDALSIFDQIVSFADDTITYEQVIENLNVLDYEYYFRLTDLFLSEDINESLMIFDEILKKGFDGHNFINGLASHFRDLLVCRDQVTVQLLEVGDAIKSRYKEQAAQCTPQFLIRALQICNSSDLNYRTSKNKRLHVELTLINLCNILSEKKKDELVKKKPHKEGGRGEEPIKKTPIKSFSIKASYKEKIEKAKNVDSEVTYRTEIQSENKPFTLEDVLKVWNEYVGDIESSETNEGRVERSLKEISPAVDKNKINLAFVNQSVREDFNSKYKSRLENIFHEKLQNRTIKIDTELKNIDEDDKEHLFTDDKKFEFLSKKNPSLVHLKQQFNLDFE